MRYALALVLCLVSVDASAQRNDAEMAVSSARSVSRFVAVKHFCPDRIPTDARYAETMADAFTSMGRKVVSKEAWSKLMILEGQRRFKEVEITGKQEWCENQRHYMEDLGDRKMF
ncbi:hypothetical protein, partial [Escherichia coli]|uniref:hypothetical protein n=1 Tax=Escherichia coli TaxID=562 RepID=UPI0005C55BEA